MKGISSKDFESDQEIRWCPGCGDFSILKQVKTILPLIKTPKEDIVFISGIGCSSRFPYYLNTYGIHGIHGRAPALATGLKIARPELDLWIITGDGDGLSIGGNHLIHLFRRNLNVQVLLFNNEIYGLTKGQFSPTSPIGKRTKTSPLGVIDKPFNPLKLALGAGATFIARTIDRQPSHIREVLLKSHAHCGTSFLEIYQNCNVFNDNAFSSYTERDLKEDSSIYIENGQPLIFGKNNDKGIRLDGLVPQIVSLSNYSKEDLWIHDESDLIKTQILLKYFEDSSTLNYPKPFGVIYVEQRDTYEDLFHNQNVMYKNHELLQEILQGSDYWEIN